MHCNPGPALRPLWQPNLQQSNQHAAPTQTPGDGHCLQDAVQSSVFAYLYINLSASDIIKYSKSELLENADNYRSFLYANSLPFELHISNYFKHKVWFSDLCDIMPFAIANSFGINIVIFTPSRQSQYIEVLPLNVPAPTPYIILYLNHDHYSGTIPSQCLFTNTAFMTS